MRIAIHNTTKLDKSEDEWSQNVGKNGFFRSSGGSKYNYTDDDYIDIIKKSIPKRLDQIPIKDEPLTKEESLSLKKVLEERIQKLLVGREQIKFGRPTIHLLGEEINLDVFPTAPNEKGMLVSIFFNSYSIIEECLNEEKPVYLSIYEEND